MLYFFRAEFFLTDYIYKIGNFNTDAMCTNYIPEGYYDLLNLTKSQLDETTGTYSETTAARKLGRSGDLSAHTKRYDFVLMPNIGFLASPDLLLNDCELKLSFDRSDISIPLVQCSGTVTNTVTKIEIKDCVAITEYVSSPRLRTYFETVDNNPIIYEYDDCEVIVKSVTNGLTEIQFENIRGGNMPSYLFAGLIETKSLTGDLESSSTSFFNHKVKEFNITMNGNSVNGYPLTIDNVSPIFPMHKFLDVTNRLYNVNSGSSFTITDFFYNWIWAHKFESELTSQGWIGINLKLTEEYKSDSPMSLVVWIISPTAISIDKFHQIEKINL